MMSWRGGWKPYVPVAARRAGALKKMQKLRKKGVDIHPVEIAGQKIAKTFWGKAWCDHIESFNDYENRLPRGRTYVRNGSVCHLEIKQGEINAMVSGSEIYHIKITIKTLSSKKWTDVKKQCAGKIGSVLELLQGKLSGHVMSVVTDAKKGLFPLSREIQFKCDCPDWAVMCKHVAAVLYGVGARLDENPQLLFRLRGVDHQDLIHTDEAVAAVTGKSGGNRKRIAKDAMADVFGIEMAEDITPTKARPSQARTKKVVKAKKRTSTTILKTTANKKKVLARKRAVKKISSKEISTRPVTGKMVFKLRAKFDMSQAQFAKLLGVSPSSIGKWEKKPTTLNLQPRIRQAWNVAIELKKQPAWRKMKKS